MLPNRELVFLDNFKKHLDRRDIVVEGSKNDESLRNDVINIVVEHRLHETFSKIQGLK